MGYFVKTFFSFTDFQKQMKLHTFIFVKIVSKIKTFHKLIDISSKRNKEDLRGSKYLQVNNLFSLKPFSYFIIIIIICFEKASKRLFTLCFKSYCNISRDQYVLVTSESFCVPIKTLSFTIDFVLLFIYFFQKNDQNIYFNFH